MPREFLLVLLSSVLLLGAMAAAQSENRKYTIVVSARGALVRLVNLFGNVPSWTDARLDDKKPAAGELLHVGLGTG